MCILTYVLALDTLVAISVIRLLQHHNACVQITLIFRSHKALPLSKKVLHLWGGKSTLRLLRSTV